MLRDYNRRSGWFGLKKRFRYLSCMVCLKDFHAFYAHNILKSQSVWFDWYGKVSCLDETVLYDAYFTAVLVWWSPFREFKFDPFFGRITDRGINLCQNKEASQAVISFNCFTKIGFALNIVHNQNSCELFIRPQPRTFHIHWSHIAQQTELRSTFHSFQRSKRVKCEPAPLVWVPSVGIEAQIT